MVPALRVGDHDVLTEACRILYALIPYVRPHCVLLVLAVSYVIIAMPFICWGLAHCVISPHTSDTKVLSASILHFFAHDSTD